MDPGEAPCAPVWHQMEPSRQGEPVPCRQALKMDNLLTQFKEDEGYVFNPFPPKIITVQQSESIFLSIGHVFLTSAPDIKKRKNHG